MLDISVIIPCYNSEKYISKTVESILSQTISPKEVILIDDGSKDKTFKILKEKQKRHKDIIKVIKLKENKGVSFARNYGIQNAQGEYILFVDSDDVAEPKLIEMYISRLKELNVNQKDKYILCYSAYTQIDKDGNEISGTSRGIQLKPGEVLGYKFIRNYISTSGTLVEKDKIIKTGGFRENVIYSEDWDLWLRLAVVGGFAYIDEPLVKIRRHGENVSTKVTTVLNAEKNILKQYDIEYIKNAIFKRNLKVEQNIIDYVSILFRLDNWEMGFFELKRLLESGCDFYNLYFYLGLYYLKVNDFGKALEYFNRTINIKNTHGAALNNIGALFLLEKNRDNAKKYLSLAIKYFPSYMDANNNLKLLNRESISSEKLQFTWRELREVLTKYNG